MKNILEKRIKPWYHFCVAFLGAALYGFPSRHMLVIGVTGTKGKSSTIEMLASIFEDARYKVALLDSIRVKIADYSVPNRMRMSMPGRFFIQGFLSRALRAGCTVALIEMTSQGAVQYRERGIAMDGFVFLNLAPEHIESHGSFDAYAAAKFRLGRQLERSDKRPRILITNADDPQGARYMQLHVEHTIPFSLNADLLHHSDENGGTFAFDGETITMRLPGEFSLKNALAAATTARAFGVATRHIKAGLEKMTTIPGRAERIDTHEPFAVVVDYAHTPDSLEALYQAYGATHKICVLGSTGGTRDAWNRPEKGRLAGMYCEHVILTDEDPCDDDPRSIIDSIQSGIPKGVSVEVVPDRRAAIARALSFAKNLCDSAGANAGTGINADANADATGSGAPSTPGKERKKVAVLITGKGTEPSMYGPHGSALPWNEAEVVREELAKFGSAGKATS